MCDLFFYCNWILLFFMFWSLGGLLRDLTVVTSSGGALQRRLCVPASRSTSFTAVYILFVCMMMIPLGVFPYVYFWFTEILTKEIGRRFIFCFPVFFFGFDILLTNVLELSCDVPGCVCLCVCVVGFAGCLTTGLIIYLFQDFWVTFICSADFKRCCVKLVD